VRAAFGFLSLLPLVAALAACGASGPQVSSSRACHLLTAGDVSAALALSAIAQPPPIPPRSPFTGQPVGACAYRASTAPAGATLFLYQGLSLNQLEGLSGSRPVSGIGASAVLRPSMLFGVKHGIGFQIVLVWNADPERRQRALLLLGARVARRL
jgi:hypothetical protein